jgi:hypothetical protein
MPSITVNGMPLETSQETLEQITREMVEVARGTSTINYDGRDVMVWFPRDLMTKGLGEEFSIDIACLDRPPDSVREGPIAEKFGEVVAKFFPNYLCIECYLQPFLSRAGESIRFRRAYSPR